MKKCLTIFLFTVVVMQLSAQAGDSVTLRGQVVYKGVPVANENVINMNSEKATITNEKGEFNILVKVGDVLAFSAVNYKLKTIEITTEIIQKKLFIVEVTEKVTELEEVIVSPEAPEASLIIKSESFKGFDYDPDASTPVVNNAISQSERGMQYGLNFVNVFKALSGLFKSKKKKNATVGSTLKPSKVLRQLYEDEFFVVDLRIPEDKIDAFLYYCDDKISDPMLLKKENEFQLMDFLVNQSKAYRKTLE